MTGRAKRLYFLKQPGRYTKTLGLAATWSLYPDSCFSGRAGFSVLDPSDGGWSLYPMGTVLAGENSLWGPSITRVVFRSSQKSPDHTKLTRADYFITYTALDEWTCLVKASCINLAKAETRGNKKLGVWLDKRVELNISLA